MLTTLADVKTALSISGSSEDARLTLAIAAAEQAIANACNRPLGFLSQTITAYYDGLGFDSFYATYVPIVSVTSLSLMARKVATAYLAANYDHNADTGRFWLVNGSVFPEGMENIKLVYVAGYADQPSVPADLQGIARNVSAIAYRTALRDPTVRSENLGSYAYVLAQQSQDLTSQARMISGLEPYIRGGSPR